MKKILTFAFLSFTLLLLPSSQVFAKANITWSTTKLNDWASVTVIKGNEFGINIIDKFIHTFFTKQDDIAAPDYEPPAIFQNKLSQYVTSDWFITNNKIVPFTNNIISSSLYCAIISSHTKYADSNPSVKYIVSNPGSVEKSETMPHANESFQASEHLAAIKALYTKNINTEGNLDYAWPDRILTGINTADCRRHKEGGDNEPVPADLRSFAQFGGDAFALGKMPLTVMILVSQLIDGAIEWFEKPEETPVRNSVVLTQKSENEYHSHNCFAGKCPGEEVGDETKGLDTQGGYTNELLPYDESRNIPSYLNTYYDINILGFGTAAEIQDAFNAYHNAIEYMKLYGCAGSPDGYQDKLSLSEGKFPIADVCGAKKKAQCPIDVILEQNPSVKDNSCGLCAGAYPKDTYLSPSEQSAFPSGMPPNLVKVLKFVGGLYSVPPSLLLATMLEEGSFLHPETWKWTDQTVKDYSLCTTPDPMPSCMAFVNSNNAIGPMGLFQTQIDGATGENDPYAKLKDDPLFKDVLANRPEGTFSACNFLDAAIYAAWDIKKSHSIYQKDYDPIAPLQCVINGETIPTSTAMTPANTCSAWDTSRAQLARLQYSDRICESLGSGIERTNHTFETYSCSGSE